MCVTTRTDMDRNPCETCFKNYESEEMPKWPRIYNPSGKNRIFS